MGGGEGLKQPTVVSRLSGGLRCGELRSRCQQVPCLAGAPLLVHRRPWPWPHVAFAWLEHAEGERRRSCVSSSLCEDIDPTVRAPLQGHSNRMASQRPGRRAPSPGRAGPRRGSVAAKRAAPSSADPQPAHLPRAGVHPSSPPPRGTPPVGHRSVFFLNGTAARATSRVSEDHYDRIGSVN